MKIKLSHAQHIANKIAIDIFKSGLVTLNKGLEPVAKIAEDLIVEDVQKETALEQKVSEILEENEDEMEFQRVDRKSMFWLIKKKLAKEYGVVLSYEDRYNDLAHRILQTSWKGNLLDYSVSENRAKNIIYGAIEEYLQNFEGIEEVVAEKISHYKKKPAQGSEEYDLIFDKLYEEELRKRGMML
ncbi:MAG: DUF507 family protein [Sulfurospirillaceae bacterium]|nr:DUF507 family protein [Sulfurospirillaceae bacterium]